jgi:gliding motility-associated-like protein
MGVIFRITGKFTGKFRTFDVIIPYRKEMLRSRILLLQCLMIFIGLLNITPARATHQRAAEITYRHVSGLTYEITLISYTFTPSQANAYRDFLTILWGDGTSSEIPRVDITYLPDSITYNKYIGQHTFPGPSTFTISCEDPNRNGGIINIPNSVNTPLYIYSVLTINPFLSPPNNSPVLLIPPVDNGCVHQPFYHNPGAYDSDGDSLSYKLVPCRGIQGQVIPGYSYPAATNTLTLDPVSGDLFWDSPKQQGEFNIAILIEEWRSGRKIGAILRDMQIIVVACQNQPPVIEPIADTCIEAGKNLRFTVKADDPDNNLVTLTGTGGPLVLTQSPATLEPNPSTGVGHTEAGFKWNTICEHVKKSSYNVFFKAKDNANPVNLVTIQSMKIRVVGPAPENLVATPAGNTITLQWDNYSCTNASGYLLFRKTDSTGFVPGYCQTGVPGYLGYSQIASISNLLQTSYTDDNNGLGLARGLRYCYLLVALFPDGAESYASAEACATLKKDVAIITNVSINKTDVNDGQIYVAWSMPTEIDTVQAPGPYKYLIYRAKNDLPTQYVLLDSLSNLPDTIYNDLALNTSAFHYSYRVDLYNVTPGNRFLIGMSQPASSVFLTIKPRDKRLNLSWTNNVPWTNTLYIIYRKSPQDTGYDSIGSSPIPYFSDKGLINGLTYCYKVKTTGGYSLEGVINPIINYSQETCAVPSDNIPPCPPVLSVQTQCDISTNKLSWVYPENDTCDKDIARFLIFFSPGNGTPVLIDSVTNPSDSVYYHTPAGNFIGCYRIIAVDSVGNKSDSSNKVCIDIGACPDFLYRLPNVFTPNGDDFNNLFKPFPYKSVTAVNLEIWDRWGRMVFKTQSPDINWDGTDMTTGQPCSDGTYYYTGEVYETTLSGSVPRSLHGSVTLLR